MKDGILRPILDIRHLNRALMMRLFRMITSKQILLQICPRDWFFSLNLKDAYIHIQIAPHSFIHTRSLSPPQSVSKDVGPHGLSIFGTSVGPASHAAPSVPAETSRSSTRLASQTPPYQGEPGLRCSSGPLEKTSVDGHGLQKEGGLNRRLQLRLGGTVWWKTGFRPLIEKGRSPSHQLPGNAGSMFWPSHFSVRSEGASHLSPFGQYNGGVLYKSPGRSLLEALLYYSRAPLDVFSPPRVIPVALTQFYVTYRWFCPSCKTCWKRFAPLLRSRSM